MNTLFQFTLWVHVWCNINLWLSGTSEHCLRADQWKLPFNELSLRFLSFLRAWWSLTCLLFFCRRKKFISCEKRCLWWRSALHRLRSDSRPPLLPCSRSLSSRERSTTKRFGETENLSWDSWAGLVGLTLTLCLPAFSSPADAWAAAEGVGSDLQ